MASYSITNTNTSVTFWVSGLTVGDEVWFIVRDEPFMSVYYANDKLIASSDTMTYTVGVPENGYYATNCHINSEPWMGPQCFSTGGGGGGGGGGGSVYYAIEHTNYDVTFTVYGTVAGDEVWFVVRNEPFDGKYYFNGSIFATGSPTVFTVNVPPNGSYAVNCHLTGSDWMGPYNFTTDAERPEDWTWNPYLYSGCPYENLTTELWSSFQRRVNMFREYKAIGDYAFTAPVSGKTLLITLWTEAENAIAGIPGSGALPGSRTLSMTYLNGLASALNAVK